MLTMPGGQPVAWIGGVFRRDGDRANAAQMNYGPCDLMTVIYPTDAGAGTFEVRTGTTVIQVPQEPQVRGVYGMQLLSPDASVFQSGELLRFSVSGDVFPALSLEVRIPPFLPAEIDGVGAGRQFSISASNPAQLDWPPVDAEIRAEFSGTQSSGPGTFRALVCIFDGRAGHAVVPAAAMMAMGPGRLLAQVGASCRVAVRVGEQWVTARAVHGRAWGGSLTP